MSDSKKLPTIEVRFPNNEEIWKWWQTQTFQKEQGEQEYTMIFEIDLPKILKAFMESFSNEASSEVLKPSKARVYSESDLKKAYEQGLEDGYHFDGSRSDWEAEGLSSHLSDEYVKSLNTDGK